MSGPRSRRPHSRRAPGAVFDSRRNRMIVFGGDDADLGDRNDYLGAVADEPRAVGALGHLR